MRKSGFLTVLTLAASSLAFDPRELKQLLHVVDPRTCGCRPPQHCQVEIPHAQHIGFRCQSHNTRLCCSRRSLRNGLSSTKNLRAAVAEKVAMLPEFPLKQKQLSVALQELLIDEKDRHRVMIKSAVAGTPQVEQESQPEVTKRIQVVTLKEWRNEACTCAESESCPVEKQDFLFGRSCGFGKVRCCAGSVADAAVTVDLPVKLVNEDHEHVDIIEDRMLHEDLEAETPEEEEEEKEEPHLDVSPTEAVVTKEEHLARMRYLAWRRQQLMELERKRQYEKSLVGQVEAFFGQVYNQMFG